MAKSKHQFLKSIAAKFKREGVSSAVEYGLIIAGINPSLRDFLFENAPFPVSVGMKRVEAERKARRELNKINDKCRVDATASADDRIGDLVRQLESARLADNALRFLAGLSPIDRDKIATKDERRGSIALRKASIKTGEVREMLGCSLAELNRWNKDGRLPHLYEREMLVSSKIVRCRFWLIDDVESSARLVDEWRRRDEAIRKAKRCKLKLIRA